MVCSKFSFSKHTYHIGVSQLVCIAKQLASFCMTHISVNNIFKQTLNFDFQNTKNAFRGIYSWLNWKRFSTNCIKKKFAEDKLKFTQPLSLIIVSYSKQINVQNKELLFNNFLKFLIHLYENS